MEKNKLSGCMTIIVVIAIILIVGGILNHVSEQVEKLDWFTNTFIGVIILALILGIIYFYDQSRNK